MTFNVANCVEDSSTVTDTGQNIEEAMTKCTRAGVTTLRRGGKSRTSNIVYCLSLSF